MKTIPIALGLVMLALIAGRIKPSSGGELLTPQSNTRTCSREDLKLKEGQTDAAMGGERAADYILTNKSATACTLKGYPKAQLLNRQNRVVRRAVNSGKLFDDSAGTPPLLVTLEPGKTAWFRIHYNSGGAGQEKPCPTYRLQVLAPGVSGPFVFRTFSSCPGTELEVSPLRAGQPDYGATK